MIAAAFVAGINHLLDGAAWARARLAPYAGRRAQFISPPWQMYLYVTDAGRFRADDAAGTPDVTIRLPAVTPLDLLQGIDSLMAQAHVEGHAEFATTLSFVFRNLHWDVEEDLSRFVGDIAAHRIVRIAEQGRDSARSAVRHLNENMAEYLAHEQAFVLGRAEFAQFRTDMERLLRSLDRLEQRLAV